MKRSMRFALSLLGLDFVIVIAGCGGGGAGAPAARAITVVVAPATASVQAGGTQAFTATVANDSANKGVTWTVSCSAAACGTVSPTATASGAATTYTAPTTPAAGDLTVTIIAASVTNTSASASATVTVPGITVAVTPSTATVPAGTTAQLTATVTNDSANQGVTWTVSCSAAPCGTVSPTATASGAATTYTAPTTPPAGNLTVTLTATSVTNTSASGSAIVTVPAITVSVDPSSALLPVSITQQFTATVKYDSTNKGVTWTLTQGGTGCSPGCGSVTPSSTASGSPTTYTAPAAVPVNPTVTLTATSVADTTKSAAATITVTVGTVKLVPASLDFGCVKALPVHNSKSMMTTLTNTGSMTLSITGITITGTNPGDFSQTNTCTTSVGAGNSCTITVTFRPLTTGPLSADVSISDSSAGSPQQVTMSGFGTSRSVICPLSAAAVRSALAATRTANVPSTTVPGNVGTRVMDLVDSRRDDPYLVNGTKRELLVRFWYPASLTQGCRAAEYASPNVWKYFSKLVGVPLPRVKTNSCSDAPIAEGAHPIVVFTHGYTGTFTDYTFIFEDLAHRGYIVASVDHTYESTAVEFPDGRLVKSVFGSHLGNTLRGDDQALTSAVSVRLGDLKFVVDELERLNVQADSPFAGKFDMSSVAVAGHSMGGLAAFLAVEQEPRFRAGIIIDGFVPDPLIKATETPVLILAAGRERWSEDECRLWGNLRGRRLAVNLKGGEHLTPSDAIWLAKHAIKTGTMAPEKSMAAVRDYIAAFLDENLRGERPQPLLTGPSLDYPDAAVTTQEQSLCRQP